MATPATMRFSGTPAGRQGERMEGGRLGIASRLYTLGGMRKAGKKWEVERSDTPGGPRSPALQQKLRMQMH